MAIDKVLKLVMKAEDQTAKGIQGAEKNFKQLNKSVKDGEAGLSGAVNRADELESTLGKVVKIGVVLELGIAGIKSGIEGVRAASALMSGDIDAASKAAERLGDSVAALPVVGKLVGVGKELNNLFTGSQDEVDKLNKHLEATNKNLELTARYIDQVRAAGKNLDNVRLSIANAQELAAAVESQRAIVQAKQEYDAAVAKATDDASRKVSEANRNYEQTPELEDLRKLNKDIAQLEAARDRAANSSNPVIQKNDVARLNKELSDLYAERSDLQVKTNQVTLAATEKLINVERDKAIEAAKAIYDERKRLAEKASKEAFALQVKGIQDAIDYQRKLASNANINNSFDRQLAMIDTEAEKKAADIQNRYSGLIAKYEQGSAEAKQLEGLLAAELDLAAKQTQASRQQVETDRYTAQLAGEVEQAQRQGQQSKEQDKAATERRKAISELATAALTQQAELGDEAAKRELEKLKVSERYAGIQQRIADLLKDQALSESDRVRLQKQSELFDSMKAKELGGIGKTATAVKQTESLQARLFATDRTRAVDGALAARQLEQQKKPELDEMKQQTKIAGIQTKLLERIVTATEADNIRVG